MIKQIIDLLKSNDWHKSGEFIEIAKGKNELPKNFKGIKNKLKRKIKSL